MRITEKEIECTLTFKGLIATLNMAVWSTTPHNDSNYP